MDIFLLWLALSVVIGIGAAAGRGRSGVGWFFLAMLISPLIALILLVLLPSLKDRPTPATHVKCPDCAELVLKDARVCKHCGCRLSPQSEIAAAESAIDDGAITSADLAAAREDGAGSAGSSQASTSTARRSARSDLGSASALLGILLGVVVGAGTEYIALAVALPIIGIAFWAWMAHG